jgi:hypothetical protein
VSWGELLDKITILQIKDERIGDAQARANVERELTLLQNEAGAAMSHPDLGALLDRLRAVNEDLWEIEDSIREREAAADFGDGFVQLARSVYQKNDLRASIKRRINQVLDSRLIEEKSYAGVSAMPPQDRRQGRDRSMPSMASAAE